jgi:ribosomal protein L21E
MKPKVIILSATHSDGKVFRSFLRKRYQSDARIVGMYEVANRLKDFQGAEVLISLEAAIGMTEPQREIVVRRYLSNFRGAK